MAGCAPKVTREYFLDLGYGYRIRGCVDVVDTRVVLALGITRTTLPHPFTHTCNSHFRDRAMEESGITR